MLSWYRSRAAAVEAGAAGMRLRFTFEQQPYAE
jgi:hypothetical protein